jgi:hypothetical protein
VYKNLILTKLKANEFYMYIKNTFEIDFKKCVETYFLVRKNNEIDM